MTVRVEVCVDDPAGASAADDAGADRVELCSALIVGGLTPSIGTVEVTLARMQRAGVQVLIRPRAGDFVYDSAELRTMLADIDAVHRAAETATVPVGFVVGALTPDGKIDRATTGELVAAARGAPVTFHRAFDVTGNLDRSLDSLIDLGVDRVLTAGGAARALDGSRELARLTGRAAGRITVLAGGSVRPQNVAQLVADTGVSEVHFRAVRRVPQHQPPRHRQIRLSAAHAPDETVRDQTDPTAIRAMLHALQRPA